jgi:protein-disulfide isomerase
MKRYFIAFCLSATIAIIGLTSWQSICFAQTKSFDTSQIGEIKEIVRNYLLQNPGIIREVLTALEKSDQEDRVATIATAISDNRKELHATADGMMLGNPDGDVTMVEFFDYNCGYCKRATPDLLALLETDGKLRVILKEFPILSQDSVIAARASIAAAKQGRYLDFHTRLMSAKGVANEARTIQIAEQLGLDIELMRKDMRNQETKQIIAQSKELASKIGISGTPAYIVGETLIPGAIGIDSLRQVIAQVRAAN